MTELLHYESRKPIKAPDACSDDSWFLVGSQYCKVLESRYAYHRAPVVGIRLRDLEVLSAGHVIYERRKSIENPLELRFRELSRRWREETMELSSTSAKTTNFHYYQIIALGRDVVPWILRDLNENGGLWYLALRAITNENPVSPEDSGNIKKMKSSWLDWGKARGFI